MSIQLDLIEPYVTLVTGYSRVTLDIAAAVRTASATKINNFIMSKMSKCQNLFENGYLMKDNGSSGIWTNG